MKYQNLYLWFATPEERQQMFRTVLGLGPTNDWYLNVEHLIRSDRKRYAMTHEKRKEDLTNKISALEFGMYSSPYVRMPAILGDPQRLDPEILKNQEPWQPLAVYAAGIRKIYTMRSYQHRPGYWLVLQFDNTERGIRRHDEIIAAIPENRRGTGVPPALFTAISSLQLIEQYFQEELPKQSVNTKILDGYYCTLTDVKGNHPEAFTGDYIYLWEQLAAFYAVANKVEKSASCYRHWAELRPSCSDPYLNLGVLYSANNRIKDAIRAYQAGLEINPGDEYIFHNLACLMASFDSDYAALNWANEAILANPNRGLNHYCKAEIYTKVGRYQAALNSYQHALKLFDSDWTSHALEACSKMAAIYDVMGSYDQTFEILRYGLSLEPNNSNILLQLATTTGKRLNQWEAAADYAQQVLAIEPDNCEAHHLLAAIYAELSDDAQSISTEE